MASVHAGRSDDARQSLPYQPAGRSAWAFPGMVCEDADEPLPSELDTASQSRYALSSRDKLSACYVGNGHHSHDVGALCANRPCPTKCVVYYFEATVVDTGERGALSIGLAQPSFQRTRHPGWEPHSYGYHASDGRKYHDSERGESYGPTWGQGETVGCGFEAASRAIFWTRNGPPPQPSNASPALFARAPLRPPAAPFLPANMAGSSSCVRRAMPTAQAPPGRSPRAHRAVPVCLAPPLPPRRQASFSAWASMESPCRSIRSSASILLASA